MANFLAVKDKINHLLETLSSLRAIRENFRFDSGSVNRRDRNLLPEGSLLGALIDNQLSPCARSASAKFLRVSQDNVKALGSIPCSLDVGSNLDAAPRYHDFVQLLAPPGLVGVPSNWNRRALAGRKHGDELCSWPLSPFL